VTPKDDAFERKIVAALDAGAAGMRAGTAYRLQQARAAALARLAEPERAKAMGFTPALAGVGGQLGTPAGGRSLFSRRSFWIGVVMTIGIAIGYQQWVAWQQLTEIADVDTAILTSDLPIDAYLDRGFQNWLKTLASDGGS